MLQNYSYYQPPYPLECPNCGKLGFVQYKHNSYKCLYCNHQHHLDEDDKLPNSIIFVLLAVAVFILAVFLDR